MKANNTFIGTPNGNYNHSFELYNSNTSLVLMRTFENHFIILEICETPLKAIKKKHNLITENNELENVIKVHWNK